MVEVYRRDTQEKTSIAIDELAKTIDKLLLTMQKDMFEKNKTFREKNTYYVETYDEFKEKIGQGFVMAHWDGTAETAEKIQEETKATIRCIPFDEFIDKKYSAP